MGFLLSFLWPSDWHSRSRILISFFLTIFTIILRLGIPLLFKGIIDLLSHPSSVSLVVISTILIGYGLCWLLDQIVTQIRTFAILNILEGTIRKLMIKIIDHLHSLTIKFHADRRTGALTQQIHQAQTGLEGIFWGLFSFLLPTMIEMGVVISLISCFYGASFSGVLALVFLGVVILNFFGLKKITGAQALHNEKRSQASARIVDSLLNFTTIKHFNNEDLEHRKLNSVLAEQENAGIKRYRTDIVIQIGYAFIISIGLISLTWMSGRSVYNGTMSLGDFALINGYLIQFAMPLQYLGYLLHQLRRGIQDLNSLRKICQIQPEIRDAPEAVHLSSQSTEISFENVCFSYVRERSILKDISFTVSAGNTIAIVGPTGSGKSTIAQLLFRFYDVDSGSISINGQDIRYLSQSSLRKAIGIVPQDIVLFNDTLYNNIAYANPHCTQEEIADVVALVQLDAFIASLPQGYDTVVGERGLKLSGGEKQRLSIARAILKKPLVFIFDEATSALDTATERAIQANIAKISSNTTTIIIAHRLSTIIHADEIIVVDQGIIREQGTHEELQRNEGLYAQLWHEQRRDYSLEEMLL
jgi:ATP-binding cassette, subfamily B, heavy metal transporter